MVNQFDSMGRSIAFGVVGFRDCWCSLHPAIEKFGFHGRPNSGYSFPVARDEVVHRRFLRRTHETIQRLATPLPALDRFVPSSGSRPSGSSYIPSAGPSIIFGEEKFTARFGTVVSRKTSPEYHITADKALAKLRANGGGNNKGESSYYALRESLITPWPLSRKRVLALFTDDRGHMPDIGVPSGVSLRGDLLEAGIDQLHVFTTEKKMESYTWLSESNDNPYAFYHYLSKDLSKLDSTFEDFVKTSSEWDFDEDEDFEFTSSDSNPFAEFDKEFD
tara:strand:- start:3155 stop:3982 length:828 start_codon:yes stop_codon:yes gene_type:complete